MMMIMMMMVLMIKTPLFFDFSGSMVGVTTIF